MSIIVIYFILISFITSKYYKKAGKIFLIKNNKLFYNLNSFGINSLNISYLKNNLDSTNI